MLFIMLLRNAFEQNERVEISMFLAYHVSIRYRDMGNIREDNMEMSDLASKL